jgi:Fe-S cluster assembly scaffold protein SufB
MSLSKIDLGILKQVADLDHMPEGAVNLRLNGQAAVRRSTPDVSVSSDQHGGLIVEIKAGSRGAVAHVPVILSEPGFQEQVHNTFIVGENAEATIVAGCGIHNACAETSRHDGIHEIIVRAGGRLIYKEKHYGEGQGGKRVLNPTATVTLEKGASAEMEMIQIRGVDDTRRVTRAYLEERAGLKIIERLLTHDDQFAQSEIEVTMAGRFSHAQVISRGVGQARSKQIFLAALVGQAECNGHLECDAILMDQALIQSIPELRAENPLAVLTHEAAVGKIAGEQLLKLMTLGLTEEQAVNAIIDGFLH